MKETPRAKLFCAVAFGVLAILYAYLAISRENGYDLLLAGAWLLAAVYHFFRWRRAREEERAPTEPLDPKNEPPEESARSWPWGGLWGR